MRGVVYVVMIDATSNPLISMTSDTQMSRRVMLEWLALAGGALLLAPTVASASAPHAQNKGPIFVQDLPPVSLDGWKMTALEITYAPGEVDRAHRHIGFVFGYVLEGDLRFKADGSEETVYHTGQMFYEPPGTIHRVSANASTTKQCRFLAMVFVDKTKPLTVPV